MGGVIRRAELLRPEAGQRLRLVATGEEGELARIGSADIAQRVRHRKYSVNGQDVEAAQKRPRFADLTPLYPQDRLTLEVADNPRAKSSRRHHRFSSSGPVRPTQSSLGSGVSPSITNGWTTSSLRFL